jgi:protein-S-isoprenylcysteine O-methyltransferase Ste14
MIDAAHLFQLFLPDFYLKCAFTMDKVNSVYYLWGKPAEMAKIRTFCRLESCFIIPERVIMITSLIVTLFPVLFLIILFGGGELFRRRAINMDGDPPIHRVPFYVSKYSILLIWGAMLLHNWGIKLSAMDVPQLLQWLSIGLWVFGFLLLLNGRFKLGESFRIGSPQEETRLKVNGLFRCSRNPMYLGVFATIFATILNTLNPLVLVIGVFIIVVHHLIVLAEEQFLLQSFGDEYREYCRRVRRYL